MRLRLFLILFAGLILPANAADWYTGAKPQQSSDDWIVSVDASTDITSQSSYFGDILVTGAPTGTLAESGLRIRADGLGGVYSYYDASARQTVHGKQEAGAALVGYEWVSSNMAFAAYVGADIRNNTLSLANTDNPVVGTNVGAKGQFEFYDKPSVNTMVAVNGSYTTNNSAYFARFRGGYLIAPDLYVGPELATLGDAYFNQERIGLQVTGLKAGPLRFAFAAGYLYDRVRKSGAYSTIDARVGF